MKYLLFIKGIFLKKPLQGYPVGTLGAYNTPEEAQARFKEFKQLRQREVMQNPYYSIMRTGGEQADQLYYFDTRTNEQIPRPMGVNLL